MVTGSLDAIMALRFLLQKLRRHPPLALVIGALRLQLPETGWYRPPRDESSRLRGRQPPLSRSDIWMAAPTKIWGSKVCSSLGRG